MAPSQSQYTAISTEDETTSAPIKLDVLNRDNASKEPNEDIDSLDNLDSPRQSTSSIGSSLIGSILLDKPGYLTFTHGVALTISLQIGAGIFSTPSQVSQNVPSPAAGVAIWIASGLLSWTGAASLIELGLAIPKNGGVQEYLSEIWGDFAGFLLSWMTIVLFRPGSMAIVSMIFSEHLCHVILPASLQSVFASKLVAIVGVGIITFVNCLGAKTGVHTATVFLIMKLLAVTSIIVIGIISVSNGTAGGVPKSPAGWFGPDGSDPQSVFARIGHFSTAAFGALYAYGGSTAAGEVAGDMKNPQRDIPRIVNVCMAITMIAAVGMNIALYEVLPLQTMRDSLIPAVQFGISTLGPVAGIIYSLVVSMSAIGSINASLFAGARQYIASAERGYVPAIFANMHFDRMTNESEYYDNVLKKFPSIFRKAVKAFASRTERLRIEERVPIYPIVVSYCLGSLYIIVGTFNGLIVFNGLSSSIFYLLMVAGIYKLRRGQSQQALSLNGDPTSSSPNAQQRPYRAWTINPVIYFVISLAISIIGMISHPYIAIVVLGFVCVGYLIFRTAFLGESIFAWKK